MTAFEMTTMNLFSELKFDEFDWPHRGISSYRSAMDESA